MLDLKWIIKLNLEIADTAVPKTKLQAFAQLIDGSSILWIQGLTVLLSLMLSIRKC
jgi:hypothetical protein